MASYTACGFLYVIITDCSYVCLYLVYVHCDSIILYTSSIAIQFHGCMHVLLFMHIYIFLYRMVFFYSKRGLVGQSLFLTECPAIKARVLIFLLLYKIKIHLELSTKNFIIWFGNLIHKML